MDKETQFISEMNSTITDRKLLYFSEVDYYRLQEEILRYKNYAFNWLDPAGIK